MIGESAVRFLLGGTIVSMFPLVGGLFKPARFAGIFGSAPSVAIATLSLAFATNGYAYAATEARSAVVGAVGLIAYSAACSWTVARPSLPVWAAAGACWLTWLVVTFPLWLALRVVAS